MIIFVVDYSVDSFIIESILINILFYTIIITFDQDLQCVPGQAHVGTPSLSQTNDQIAASAFSLLP